MSEAKVGLSGIYTAEFAYMGDVSHYTTCLVNIGFIRSSGMTYNIGFTAGNTTVSGTAGACTLDAGRAFWAGGATAKLGATHTSTAATFLAGATARLTGGSKDDTWTINQDRVLTNTSAGVP